MDQDRITVKAEERRRLTCKTWKRFKDRFRKGWTPRMVVSRCRRDSIPMVCEKTLHQELIISFILPLAVNSEM